MIENIYIDKYKIYRWSVPTMISFLGFIIFPMYFFVKFNFFYKVSMFKILGLTAYFFMMLVWVRELILYYQFAVQKKPLVQISDEGLLFNYDKKSTFVPWHHVSKILKLPIISGVLIFLTKEAKVGSRTPFAKFGSNSTVSIVYTKSSAEENFNILMKHKDKFNK